MSTTYWYLELVLEKAAELRCLPPPSYSQFCGRQFLAADESARK